MPTVTFPLGPLETNCYLLHNNSDALIIDPGGDAESVLNHVRKNQLTLRGIIITHLHFDHIYGVAGLHKESQATVYAPKDDAFMLEGGVGGGGMWGFPVVETFPWTPLEAGQCSFGTLQCTVLHTPGHTPGSLSLYFAQENAVFTGDLLFYRSVGRSDLPGGDQDALLASVGQHIFSLPDPTHIYPGHGPATTVDDEKKNNPYCGAFVR